MSSDTASYHLVAPVRPGSVDLVHGLIEQLWTHDAPPSATDRIRFETAVIEILGNIVEHTAKIDPPDLDPRQFELTVSCDPSAITAVFGDDGKPMQVDLEGVTMPDQDAHSGRGLALALATVDELTYERQGPQNHWRLVCHRG